MKKPLLALSLLSLALAGCGGGYHNYYSPRGLGTDCTPPANTDLVYPVNNATGVPDATSAIYIAVPNALGNPSYFDVALTGPPSYGTVLEAGFTSVSYGSIPTPNTVPSYSNPQYYESTLRNSLTADTVFSVYWNEFSACTTGTSASLLGSFTTQ
jgi:hypothetical protein